MFVASVTKNVFVLGGILLACTGQGALAQTPAWNHLSSGGPSARHGHGMAYDSARGKVVLFGGQNGSTPLGDLWEWDGESWHGPISTPVGPGARYDAAMAYDSARQVVVLFGGKAGGREAGTWEWDGETWTDRGVGGPSSRWQHAMAYDAHRGVVVLFGGLDTGTPANLLNDTWVWNGGTWTQLSIPNPRPSPRGYATMAYDNERQRIVLFGGHDAGGLRGDTWEFALEFDGAVWSGSWTEQTVSDPKPSPRDAAAMAYDRTRHLTVLFGGYAAGYKHDTWAWDGTHWNLEATGGPSGRYDHKMVYNGKIFLFGGYDGAENAETWEYGESPSPEAACCFADGSCRDMAEPHCLGAGGLSWREGFSCALDPCALPPPEFTYFLGDQPLSGSAAHQVNTATGNFHYNELDFSIASRGHPLAFGRYYNSMDRGGEVDYYPLGPGWHHTYNIVLRPNDPPEHPYVSVTWSNGRVTFWEEDEEDQWKPVTKDLHDTLEHVGGQWIVTLASLDVYRFDSYGRLVSIVDRNSNTTTIGYSSDHYRRVSSVTDAAGRVLSFSYNAGGLLTSIAANFVTPARIVLFNYTNGRLTQITDLLGQHIDYAYDTDGYLVTVKDQRRATVIANTYAPDSSGQVQTYRDGNGHDTSLQYRAGETEITRSVGTEDLQWLHKSEMLYNRQTVERDPLGHEVVYTYDENFNRKSVTDHNGNRTNYTYDEQGNVTSIADPEGGTTTIEYSNLRFPHLPTRRTDPLGYVTEWTYDAHGNRLTERRYLTAPPGTAYVERAWTYNAWGQVKTVTDERGGVTTFEYDETTPGRQGLLLSVEDAEGHSTWFGYDNLWRRVWVVDGRGTGPENDNYKTHFFYDEADRLVRTEGPPLPNAPDGITRWFGYDEIGNRKWVTNGNGSVAQDPVHTTTYDYDWNSNLTVVHQPLGRITRYAYDGLDRKWKTADANGSLASRYTEYTYDHASRLTAVRDPENNIWSYTHDAHGNVRTETDPSGVTLSYEYDKLHRRTRTTDELNHTWQSQYDKLSRVTRTIDATDQATEFTYDALGRLTRVVDAAGGQTDYTYDAAGNILRILDANGHAISVREYDALNRLTRAEDGNGNYYTYEFDAVGNQTLVRDANHQPDGPVTVLSYDAENRRTAINYLDGTSVTYTYDKNGNRASMTDPKGSSLFGFDELNRLVSSEDSYGQQVGYEYDPVGNRISLTYPGRYPSDPGKAVEYGYDKANRLTSITSWSGPPTQYTYNGLRLATVTYPNSALETHVYDVAGRLIGLNTTRGGSTLLSLGWTRDGEGAPLTATETNTLPPEIPTRAVSYQYDHDNRLTESTRGTYQCDANGNLTSRTIDGVYTKFEYDQEDRLVSYTHDPDAPSSQIFLNTYDGDGLRIGRVAGDTEIRYVLDRGRSMSHVLCETNAAGEVTAYYIHGLTLSARIDGATGEPRYYHSNDLGNVAALTDGAGNVVDRYAYDPYGLPGSHEGGTPNPFTFVGALGVMTDEPDYPLGLYYMRARFYDPDTGRFLGKDPVEGALTNPLELNRYAYGLDNPVVRTDSSGEWFGIDDAIAALGGAIVGGVSTLVGDVVEMAAGAREWGEFSSWETYTGNIAGGAVGGVVTLYTANPIAGGAVGGTVGNVLKQGLEIAAGDRPQGFDPLDLALDTGFGAAGGLVSSGMKSIIKNPVGRPASKLGTILFGKNALKTTWTNTMIDLLTDRQTGAMRTVVDTMASSQPRSVAGTSAPSSVADASSTTKGTPKPVDHAVKVNQAMRNLLVSRMPPVLQRFFAGR